MPAAEAFFDTNVVLHLLSADSAKADRAEALIASGGTISVQVLNEVAAVARRRLGMPWRDVSDFLAQVRKVCRTVPLTVETHNRGLTIAAQLGLSIYDGTIVASALLAGSRVLYTEDLQHGRVFAGQLRLRNPFAS
jgi:predicted nucleic acid-binding protein